MIRYEQQGHAALRQGLQHAHRFGRAAFDQRVKDHQPRPFQSGRAARFAQRTRHHHAQTSRLQAGQTLRQPRAAVVAN